MRGGRLSFIIPTLALVISGCIGATDRADFDAEVQARGGGVSTAWIGVAIDAVAAEVGAASASELMVISLDVDPTKRALVVVARRGDEPDFVDTVVVRDGEVVAATPMQDADQLPLDEVMIRVGDLPIDDLEALSDEALEEFGEPDGFVGSILMSLQSGVPTVRIAVESARRTGFVLFDQSGRFIEVTR